MNGDFPPPEPGNLVLVTGATGLLGSHLAERLVAQGYRVRVLARPQSPTRFLDGLGVEVLHGDLISPADCDRAVEGVAWVFHCAAKVGDWGSWREFQVGCVDATRILAEAASRANVERFVHFSSTSAYGHPADGSPPVTEDAELGQNVWWMDYYTRSKVECECLLWKMAESGRLRLTVIRPSWLFGERDRTTIPRLIREFTWRRVSIIGRGDNPLSAVYAGVVADAALLAARDPNSVGEAYNITSHRPITQREFLDLLADAIGTARVTWHYPFWFAYYGGGLLELRERLRRSKKPPRVTRYGAWLLGRNLAYSTTKAREKLGWTPALDYDESIERTIAWFARNEDAMGHARKPLMVRMSDQLWKLRRALTAPVPAPPLAESHSVPVEPEARRLD